MAQGCGTERNYENLQRMLPGQKVCASDIILSLGTTFFSAGLTRMPD